jgi:hypothetical protein
VSLSREQGKEPSSFIIEGTSFATLSEYGVLTWSIFHSDIKNICGIWSWVVLEQKMKRWKN